MNEFFEKDIFAFEAGYRETPDGPTRNHFRSGGGRLFAPRASGRSGLHLEKLRVRSQDWRQRAFVGVL